MVPTFLDSKNINRLLLFLAFFIASQSLVGPRTLKRKTLIRPPIDQVSNVSIWSQNFDISLLKNNNLILQSYSLNSLSSYSIHRNLVKQNLSRILSDSNLDARSIILLAEVCIKEEFANFCKLAGFNKKRAAIDPNNLFSYLAPLVQQIKQSDSISMELKQNILNSNKAHFYFAKGLNDFNRAIKDFHSQIPIPKRDNDYSIDELTETEVYFRNLYNQSYQDIFLNKVIQVTSYEDYPSSEMYFTLSSLKLADNIQLHIFELLSQSDSVSWKLRGLEFLKSYYKKRNNSEAFKQVSIQQAKLFSTIDCLKAYEEKMTSFRDYKWNTPIYYQAYNEIVVKQGELAAKVYASNTLKNYIFNIEQGQKLQDCKGNTKHSDP